MKILLAIDGSSDSVETARMLLRLPLPSPSDVTVLTVVDERANDAGPGVDVSDDAIAVGPRRDNSLHEAAEQVVRDVSAHPGTDGWTVRSLVREGEAAHQIIEAAAELGSDLLLVGSRGPGQLRRFLLGSVSSKVIKYAPCSVLMVRHGRDQIATRDETADASRSEAITPLRILLAYDHSPSAESAVQTLAALPLGARAEVLIVTVLPLITFYGMDIPQRLTQSWRQQKETARTALEKAASVIRNATARVHTKLLEGENASHEILNAADRWDPDLIVMGHKGYSRIERLLLGSVSTRIVHHAPCSVWIVRT